MSLNTSNFIKEVEGVGIVVEVRDFIDSTKSEVLFLVENIEKPWKKRGQISIPFGTVDDGEKPLSAAVRELEEEAGIITKESMLDEKGNFVMYVNSPKGRIKINVYVYYLLLNFKPEVNITRPEEISEAYFANPLEVDKYHLNNIRPGTVEALNGPYIQNGAGIIYVDNGVYNPEYSKHIRTDNHDLLDGMVTASSDIYEDKGFALIPNKVAL